MPKGKPAGFDMMCRDGSCYFCGADEGMYAAITPLNSKARIHPKLDALYLCDDCFPMVAALFFKDLRDPVRALKKDATFESVRAVLSALLGVEDNDVCEKCHGRGRFETHDREGHSYEHVCKECIGTGRQGVHDKS